jgi:hypothetical protein
MNKRVKTKWLKALRSGKYKQGRGQLRTPDDRFCCLGVLCDLYAKETGVSWEGNGEDDDYEICGDTGFLPQVIQEWAGVDDHNPVLPRHRYDRRLSEQNDKGVKLPIRAERQRR